MGLNSEINALLTSKKALESKKSAHKSDCNLQINSPSKVNARNILPATTRRDNVTVRVRDKYRFYGYL